MSTITSRADHPAPSELLSKAPVPDELVLEALALARRVNDRLKEKTPTRVPALREAPTDEDSYRPGELVC